MVLLFGIPVFTAYGLVYRASAAYYFGLISVVVPYLILAAALGITLTMILAQIFPSQRTRDILIPLPLYPAGAAGKSRFFFRCDHLLPRPERPVLTLFAQQLG